MSTTYTRKTNLRRESGAPIPRSGLVHWSRVSIHRLHAIHSFCAESCDISCEYLSVFTCLVRQGYPRQPRQAAGRRRVGVCCCGRIRHYRTRYVLGVDRGAWAHLLCPEKTHKRTGRILVHRKAGTEEKNAEARHFRCWGKTAWELPLKRLKWCHRNRTDAVWAWPGASTSGAREQVVFGVGIVHQLRLLWPTPISRHFGLCGHMFSCC